MPMLSFFLYVLLSQSSVAPLEISNDGEELATIIREDYILLEDDLFVNETKINNLMNEIELNVYTKPENATIDKHGKIQAEKIGYTLNRADLYEQFMNYIYTGVPTEINVSKLPVYPKVDSELLSEIHDVKIGEYTTYYKVNNEERSHNIKLATKAINNYVLFPGERFSFNQIVGKRTKERGYKKAPVIVKGEFAEDIGGGICQVSSTLFNAVNISGIHIIERVSHSRNVPYVPEGKDATVSWWGPDFIFANKYDHPILIRAHAENGIMNVRIFTSDNANSNQSG